MDLSSSYPTARSPEPPIIGGGRRAPRAAGRGWAMVAPGVLMLMAALAAACSPAGDGPAQTKQEDPAEVAAERALLKSLATTVIQPSIAAFATESQGLEKAVSGWCDALKTGKEADALKTAQSAWLSTSVAWQRLLPMAIGPHADADVAEAIDSWPLVNPCAVDQGVSALLDASAKGAALDVGKSLPNRRGLDALETVLFRTSLELSCPPQAQPAGWSALPPDARRAARCAYGKAVAQDLKAQAEQLSQAWSKAGAGGAASYVEVLSTAGEKGSPGAAWASSHAALNALSDAVLSLELGMKGRRLGAPLGVAANPCGTVGVVCTKAVESPWAKQGAALMQANLAGARAVLLGEPASAPGFDDWLVRKGAQPAATALVARLDAARDALAALPTPLQDGLANDAGKAKIKAAYDAVGALSTFLSDQLTVALALKVPAAVAGDAD